MLKRIAALATVAGVALTGTLAQTASAETAGQYGVPRSGRICIEDNGWNFFNTALPELASRMRAQGVANVVVWDECNPAHDAAHTIDVTASNSPTENYCARTERTWSWNGYKWVVASTLIRFNTGIKSCYATDFAKRHVMSHEVMHSFAAVHEGRWDRVVSDTNGWDFQWPTNQDYRDLRSFGYTDLA